MATRRHATSQALPTDYLSVDDAWFELRYLPGDPTRETFPAGHMEGRIGEAVALVSALTGCDLLAVTVGNIDPDILPAVKVALRHVWDGHPDIPPVLYELCRPFRVIVQPDD